MLVLCQAGTRSLLRRNGVEGGSKQAGCGHGNGKGGDRERSCSFVPSPGSRHGKSPFHGGKGIFHLTDSKALLVGLLLLDISFYSFNFQEPNFEFYYIHLL